MTRNKIIMTVVIISFIIIGLNISNRFNDPMYKLPKGEYITESTSPNGDYTVKTYLCNGGATVDLAVRGELIVNSKFKKKRNIYWQYRSNESNIAWKDNETVVINGIEIYLPNGKYDYRVQSN
ncbi:MAG: DUF5412 family protein [Peptostreptococcaceae bacterium]